MVVVWMLGAARFLIPPYLGYPGRDPKPGHLHRFNGVVYRHITDPSGHTITLKALPRRWQWFYRLTHRHEESSPT